MCGGRSSGWVWSSGRKVASHPCPWDRHPRARRRCCAGRNLRRDRVGTLPAACRSSTRGEIAPVLSLCDHPCLRGLLGTTFGWNVGFQWLAARALLGRSRSAVRRGLGLEIRSLLRGLDECRSDHIFFALLRRFAGRRWRWRRAGELSVTPRCRRRPRNGSWCLCKQCRLLLYPSLHPAVLPESEILASSLGRLWRSSKRFCIRPRLSRNCPRFPSEVYPPIE